ncbi:hypothetical protein KEM55_004864 [Ascosphaera atra]|nr:hypothetical protein KEM55_004864 [Ascosphaera atra]
MAFRAGGKTQVSTQGGPMDKKQIDLNRNTVEQTHSFTADHGVKVTNTDNWLKAVDENRTGPHLLEDTLALQKVDKSSLRSNVSTMSEFQSVWCMLEAPVLLAPSDCMRALKISHMPAS